MTTVQKKRTLEEFFANGLKPREEYVTDPNREAAIVEEFKEDNRRNMARGSETKVVQKSPGVTAVDSAPLDVSGVISEKPPVAPAAQTPVAEEIPEIKKPTAGIRESLREETPAVQREVAAEAPQKDSSFPWDRALIGATPLLVGLLTGNKMEGAQVAGNHLAKDEGDLYKRERDLAAKLAEMKAKREGEGAGGKRRFTAQTIAVEDPSSPGGIANIKATFDTFTGQYLDSQNRPIPSNFIRSGFAVNPEEFDRRKGVASNFKRSDADYLMSGTRVNPEDGELTLPRDGKLIPLGDRTPGRFTEQQEREAEKMVKSFVSSPAYSKSINALQLMPSVTAQLDAAQRTNNPNSVAGNMVVLTMLRTAQGSGTISDADARRAGGTQQLHESADRLINKLLGQGESLTIRDIQELREISEIYASSAERVVNEYYSESKKKYQKLYGFSNEQIEGQLGAHINPFMSLKDKPVRGKSLPEGIDFGGVKYYPPKKQPNSTVPFTMDGKLFWTEPSEWDQVKKENPNAKRLK